MVTYYLAGNSGALEEGGGPGPLGDDGGGGQPDGDLAPRVESRVQVVRVAVNVFSHLGEKQFSLGRGGSKFFERGKGKLNVRSSFECMS